MILGDVYWTDLPTGSGHAQAGRRPAIIVQGTIASTLLPTVLIVPLTTRMDVLRFPGTVLIEANVSNGLRRNSVALVFQITVIDKQFLDARLGQVSDEIVQAIWSALDEITERKLSEPILETSIQP